MEGTILVHHVDQLLLHGVLFLSKSIHSHDTPDHLLVMVLDETFIELVILDHLASFLDLLWRLLRDGILSDEPVEVRLKQLAFIFEKLFISLLIDEGGGLISLTTLQAIAHTAEIYLHTPSLLFPHLTFSFLTDGVGTR